MKRIYSWEPWFFIFFGLFHLHRIWALAERESYAAFWTGIMERKEAPYYIIMGILAVLCILGIITFIRERKRNFKWRWIYVLGGIYVLFDLFAIAMGLELWQKILAVLFDTASPYWNYIYCFFILLGAAVFIQGICLMKKRAQAKT